MKVFITLVAVAVLGFLAWKFVPWNGSGRGPAQAAALALADRFHTSERYVEVLSVEKKSWPDACLGLPKKDETCAQVVTPGYQVTLKAEEETKVYRTNEDGTVVRPAN